MNDYDVKRGFAKDINQLAEVAKQVFGDAQIAEGKVIARFGAIEKLTAFPNGKKLLSIDTQMKPGVDDATAMETIKAYNRFLEAATGLSSKERKKKLNQRAKEGKL